MNGKHSSLCNLDLHDLSHLTSFTIDIVYKIDKNLFFDLTWSDLDDGLERVKIRENYQVYSSLLSQNVLNLVDFPVTHVFEVLHVTEDPLIVFIWRGTSDLACMATRSWLSFGRELFLLSWLHSLEGLFSLYLLHILLPLCLLMFNVLNFLSLGWYLPSSLSLVHFLFQSLLLNHKFPHFPLEHRLLPFKMLNFDFHTFHDIPILFDHMAFTISSLELTSLTPLTPSKSMATSYTTSSSSLLDFPFQSP